MSSSNKVDPKKLPVPWRKGAVAATDPDLAHHEKEWWSGQRGSGKVPADLEWKTNPKQSQEENGAGNLTTPISK